MHVAQKALESFYTDTRHREHDIDGPEAVTLLAKKWIALQCNAVSSKLVYPFVSNDLERLEKRTDGGVVKRYAEKTVDPDAHVYLYKHVNSAIESPIVKVFQQQVLPRPEREQRWQTETRADKWKDAAFFMATVCHKNKPNFRQLVSAIVQAEPTSKEFENKDAFEQLYQRLQNWNEHMEPAELGKLINSLEWSDVNNERLYLVACGTKNEKENTKEEEEEEEEDEEEEMNIDIPVAVDHPVKWTLEKEAEYRNISAIKSFKVENQLSNQFDGRKVAKQIIALGTVAPHQTQNVLDKVAGKRQVHFHSPHPMEKEQWHNVLECLQSSDIAAVIQHPQVQQFYRIMVNNSSPVIKEWKSGQDVISAFLTSHLTNWQDNWKWSDDKQTRDAVERHRRITRYVNADIVSHL